MIITEPMWVFQYPCKKESFTTVPSKICQSWEDRMQRETVLENVQPQSSADKDQPPEDPPKPCLSISNVVTVCASAYQCMISYRK